MAVCLFGGGYLVPTQLLRFTAPTSNAIINRFDTEQKIAVCAREAKSENGDTPFNIAFGDSVVCALVNDNGNRNLDGITQGVSV